MPPQHHGERSGRRREEKREEEQTKDVSKKSVSSPLFLAAGGWIGPANSSSRRQGNSQRQVFLLSDLYPQPLHVEAVFHLTKPITSSSKTYNDTR